MPLVLRWQGNVEVIMLIAFLVVCPDKRECIFLVVLLDSLFY